MTVVSGKFPAPDQRHPVGERRKFLINEPSASCEEDNERDEEDTEDEEEEEDDDYDYDYDDDDEDEDDEENDQTLDSCDEQDEEKENEGMTGSGATQQTGDKDPQRRQRAARGRRRRRLINGIGARRLSGGCPCEPMANRVDSDGLLVTDVDLATYRDLCKMEHMRSAHWPPAANSMEAAGPEIARNRFVGSNHASMRPESAAALTTGSGNGRNSLAAPFSNRLRRSSLQEESGAYYQLCTSNEEQLIRRKYLWFPPALRQLELVDKFFAQFSKEKIPFAANQANSLTEDGSSKDETSVNCGDEQVAATSRTGSQATGTTGQQHPADAASYRDEQISFQLPRQDISLDYCSYPMDEASRSAYSQFIERRNSQALDVGSVIQVGPTGSSSRPPPTSAFQSSDRADSGQLASRPSSSRRQRKASTQSQSAAIGVMLTSGQMHQSGRGLTPGCGGPHATQRCRRCLVRFEPEQLAVVAPNFIIGSALYPISRAAAAAASACSDPPAAAHLNRRASTILAPCSRQPAATCSAAGTVSDGEGHLASIESRIRGQQSRSSALEPAALQAPPNAALFHPTCFTCSTCKEFLVDLVYCLRDNKLYCLRHYGESLRPRCSWCRELIFSDEYLKAMNESFHVDHFLCRHCDSNLAGQRYVLKEEKPFCVQCYEGNFANNCEDCHKAIGIDSRDLSYKDRHWHDTCFVCNKCQSSLIDKPFGSKLDKVYCADCYDVTFATRCDGCKNPFRAGSKKMEYRGRQWHDSCFCCCVCLNTIGSNSFIPKNDEIYCIKCYEDKYATRCTKCKLVIVSGGVTFRNEPWHRDCFNCCNCNKSLAGQRFTTRDVAKETVTDTNKTNQPHNAYCIDCYGELFAKKCYACSQAITGLGGTRFVTFEDRSWHNDCFLCNDCNQSLVGKGFITDGPETILCGDCARAKLR